MQLLLLLLIIAVAVAVGVLLLLLEGRWDGRLALLLAGVHAVDGDGTGARLVQILDAALAEHLRWLGFTSVLGMEMVSCGERAFGIGKDCAGLDRWELSGTSTKIWQWLFDLTDSIAQLHLLIILQV